MPSPNFQEVEQPQVDDGVPNEDAVVLLQEGSYVVLDLGFCILLALIELKKVGIFICVVIKQQ